MKKHTVLLIFSLFTFHFSLTQAQDVNIAGPSTYTKCSRFYITKPLRELPVIKPGSIGKMREAADSIRRAKLMAYRARFTPGPFLLDPVMQTSTPEGHRVSGSIAPIENFDGTQENPLLTPPDPDGAVGPNHFVEAINMSYQVFNKNGVSLAGPIDLATLFPGSEDDGDPIVLYDKFADRWFISEFQVPNSGDQYLLAAVSKTNDPTGQYYVWWFNLGLNNPDYPKYSIWTDGYYCTYQFFYPSSGLVNPQQITVLERNRMLVGSPSAGMITASLPSSTPFGGNNSLPSAPKTFDCDGALPPYGTPNYLAFFENTNSGGYSNSIVLYKLATDTTHKTITVSQSDSMATAPFNAFFNAVSYNDISQPTAPNSLDALDGTFNFRVPYMRFVGYNSVVLCNTVNTGSLIAGIRWYEIRQDLVSGKWSIYQQGTYAPADGVNRWNGSICMDDYGDISLAYSVSSGSVYPGICYTGRAASDPLGVMTAPEQTAITGSSTWGVDRWGDYSQTTLDPTDGATFWHVNEYCSGGIQKSRIFSFKLYGVLGIPTIEDSVEMKVYLSGKQLNVLASGLPSAETVLIDLFDINGKQLSSRSMSSASGRIETQINVSGLAAGMYLVRIGNLNFQKIEKVMIE